MIKPNLAMIGMAVMGSNFAQNFAEKGYDIALFNRTDAKTLAAYNAIPDDAGYKRRLHPVTGDAQNLVNHVGSKGTYLIMVKAGEPTQMMIDQLLPHLKEGAVVVDCANSYWPDTEERCKKFEGTGIHFFGAGVSGGEEGARRGPAIMVGGGSEEVYRHALREPLQAVAAKAVQDGKPCVAYFGKGGAGHFVKMIHNGIEYGDMQLIAEAYDIMKQTGMPAEEIADVFSKWNEGPLKSYLTEITAEVLRQEDPSGNGQLVEHILDRAMMKGTGTWMTQDSLRLDLGVEPIPTIYAAVESRAISARKEQRELMSKILLLERNNFKGDKQQLIGEMEQALYVAKISSYAQGIALMQAVDKENDFGGLDIAEIARIWRAGCIIRAEFLEDITEAYDAEPQLPSLMAAAKFKEAIQGGMESLESICITAAKLRVPVLALDSSKDYILQSVNAQLPLNLTQAQRDYFGAHTYERTDQDRGKRFHLDWSGDRKEREV